MIWPIAIPPPIVELNLPGHVAWAIRWLRKDTPALIGGKGGGDTVVDKVVPVSEKYGIPFALTCKLIAKLIHLIGKSQELHKDSNLEPLD